jgi:hypothetical protein
MTLDEYLQQQGYEYRPQLEDTYAASWGKYRDDGEGGRIFDPLESHVSQKYYNDPSRFTATRESQFGQGINTFNEGNEDQKRVIDQINSGQLYIAPRIERGRGEDQGYAESTSYELRDSKTGNVVNQQVIPIDPSKGIFNVVADDRNSSGFFNNYVSTDPSGFVNPIVSEQQSQYASRKNSSADFYRNSLLASLSMTGLAFPGLGEALGAATGLGTVGGNVALNTGINALKQGITGQFNPLALATSAALSYGMGGSGAEGADPLTADDMYTGQAMTNLASSDDATRLADLVRAFENPTELTGPTINVASNPTVELGNATVDESYGLPNVPKDLQNEAYLDPSLIDVAPDNVTISSDGTYQMGQGTSLSQDAMTNRLNPFYGTANPELSANYNTVSNLVGGGAESNLAALDQLSSNSLIPLGGGGIGGTELGSVGSILGSGKGLGQQTLAQVLAPTGLSGLTVQDLESDKPMYETTETTPLTKPKLLSNILKSSLPQSLKTAQASQQQSNLANILRSTQMPQTALPAIYKQANPFNFGQQNQPVQDVSELAKLLRTA